MPQNFRGDAVVPPCAQAERIASHSSHAAVAEVGSDETWTRVDEPAHPRDFVETRIRRSIQMVAAELPYEMRVDIQLRRQADLDPKEGGVGAPPAHHFIRRHAVARGLEEMRMEIDSKRPRSLEDQSTRTASLVLSVTGCLENPAGDREFFGLHQKIDVSHGAVCRIGIEPVL